MGDLKLKQDMTKCRIYQLPLEVATLYHSVYLHTIKIILTLYIQHYLLICSQQLLTSLTPARISSTMSSFMMLEI